MIKYILKNQKWQQLKYRGNILHSITRQIATNKFRYKHWNINHDDNITRHQSCILAALEGGGGYKVQREQTLET
jgi:mannose-6-phosphate isomerase class I